MTYSLNLFPGLKELHSQMDKSYDNLLPCGSALMMPVPP
uniref:Uncharacterized protein n=1 Tax=Anguilla anguilla TaxID=7936 RepID=A0A0E9UYA1_ANGAN